MPKSYIKINQRDITIGDLKAMLSSQRQLTALNEMVEAARHNKEPLEKSYSETFLAEVKKIL